MSNYFTSLNLDKSDIYFIIYILYKISKESFTTPAELESAKAQITPAIRAAVSEVYSADIEALRNLSSIAAELVSNNTLTHPGILKVTNNIIGQGNLTISGDMTISGKINNNIKITNNALEFGVSDIAKNYEDGKIGYGLYNSDALVIVGKGPTDNTRKVFLWDNLKVFNRIATNGLDTNDFPPGWNLGGIRTLDIFSSAAIAVGPDKDHINFLAYNNGNVNCNNITCNSIKIGNWLIQANGGDEMQFTNSKTGKGVLFGYNNQIYNNGHAIY